MYNCMIPKIVHYCWFGRGEIPELERKCIASWHKFMPGWEYKLWNEDNFDVENSINYVKQAYAHKKYAFVSDYVRLWALYNYGGVYLDTDVEVIRSLDDFLVYPAFSGYEGDNNIVITTAVIGSEVRGIWVNEMIDSYERRPFILRNGELDMTANTRFIAGIMLKNGFSFSQNNIHAIYKNCMHVFPVDYFCPLTSTRVLKLTSNTCCIHHFAGSWVKLTPMQKFKLFVTSKILGVNLTDKIVNLKRKLFKKNRA